MGDHLCLTTVFDTSINHTLSLLESGVADVSYTATGLIQNKIYTYKVEAFNLIGYGLRSNKAYSVTPTTASVSYTSFIISQTATRNSFSPLFSTTKILHFEYENCLLL